MHAERGDEADHREQPDALGGVAALRARDAAASASRCQRRLKGWVARPAAAQPGAEQREHHQQPDEAEVGERLHDEAVGLADVEDRRAVAQAGRFVAFGADPEQRGGPAKISSASFQ